MAIKNKILHFIFALGLMFVAFVAIGPAHAVFADEASCIASGGTFTAGTCGRCPTGTTSDGASCVADSATPGTTGTDCSTGTVTSGTVCTGDFEVPSTNQCGKGTKKVTTGFNFGCRGDNFEGMELNPIIDIAFAIFRFLSAGVGIVVVGSIIVAGIQYSASRGNPQSTEAAIKRVTNSIIGLLIFIFMFAIINFIVPNGLLL